MLSPEWSNCIIKTHLKRLIYYDNHGGHYGYCMTSTRVVSVWNDLNWLTLLYIANIKMIKEKFMVHGFVIHSCIFGSYECRLNDSIPWPFHLQKWLPCNFSLQHPYIIQQTGNENTQTYQVKVLILI